MKYKIIYTADLHGNQEQYKKLVDYSIKVNTNAIIIGGDIAPKDPSRHYIEYQRKFLEYPLPEILKPLRSSDIKLFLMLSNDDCSCNLDVLEKKEPSLYRLINQKRLSLINNFDIVGYSYVPITPFRIKDWEKYDLTNVPKNLEVEYANRKLTNYNLNGYKSTRNRWKKFVFKPQMEKYDSIQKDLSKNLFTEKPNKTLYVFHSPPNRTNLDQVINKTHVGSIAIRLFIEKYQPYLTLHGHIHETVDVSGNFKDKIGNTLCMSCGNHSSSSQLALLEFDLYNPKDVKRIIP